MKGIDTPEKLIIDALSVVTVAGALIDMLPAVAAVFTIVWTAIRIYETETIQKLVKRKKPHDSDEESQG